MTKKIKTTLSGIMAMIFVVALLIPLFAVGCTDNGAESTITSIEIYPTNVQLEAGQTSQFLATATYSNGSVKKVTTKVTWISSNTTVATISTGGLAEAKVEGATTVTATLEDEVASATLTVRSQSVKSPATTSTPTPAPTPTTSIDSIADTVSSLTSITGTASVTSGVSGIRVKISRNDTDEYWNGEDWQYAAYWLKATASDGSFGEEIEDWIISSATAPSLPSFVTGVRYYVWAKAYSGSTNGSEVTEHFTRVTSIATPTPTPTPTPTSTPTPTPTATVLSIKITGNTTVEVGQYSQFTITANYSNGSTQQVSSGVSWSSSDMGVATITTGGLAEAKAPGTTTIIASLGGQIASLTLSASMQITDQLGRTVTFNSTPQRIISISPANTEILFAVGLGDKVVGDTTYCNYPEEALNVTKVGSFSKPDIEKILELQPDVVFAAPIHEAEVIPQLESLGITVITLAPATVNDVYDAIELVGKVSGAQEAAASLIENMSTRINAVTSIVVNHPEKSIPDVFFILWHDPLMTVGHDTLISQLIVLAGGKNMFDDLTGYPVVSLETVLDRNPDIILAETDMAENGASLNWALNESLLQETNAYKNGKILGIDGDTITRFGPRIADALEEMFKLIHPDLAAELE